MTQLEPTHGAGRRANAGCCMLGGEERRSLTNEKGPTCAGRKSAERAAGWRGCSPLPCRWEAARCWLVSQRRGIRDLAPAATGRTPVGRRGENVTDSDRGARDGGLDYNKRPGDKTRSILGRFFSRCAGQPRSGRRASPPAGRGRRLRERSNEGERFLQVLFSFPSSISARRNTSAVIVVADALLLMFAVPCGR